MDKVTIENWGGNIEVVTTTSWETDALRLFAVTTHFGLLLQITIPHEYWNAIFFIHIKSYYEMFIQAAKGYLIVGLMRGKGGTLC